MTELMESAPASLHILRGAGPIAAFLYGADTPSTRRFVYRDRALGRLPSIFQRGQILCGRPHALRADVEASERAAREKAEQAAAKPVPWSAPSPSQRCKNRKRK
jgi:hypothetical protein